MRFSVVMKNKRCFGCMDTKTCVYVAASFGILLNIVTAIALLNTRHYAGGVFELVFILLFLLVIYGQYSHSPSLFLPYLYFGSFCLLTELIFCFVVVFGVLAKKSQYLEDFYDFWVQMLDSEMMKESLTDTLDDGGTLLFSFLVFDVIIICHVWFYSVFYTAYKQLDEASMPTPY
ncbi:hypothetical protein niasHS_006216 [Heterodera schachtii]|uniref:MARVEL domain-containing protein n=1 Tax=Heterodera schachtii TaxID=97005 RepID=A0ABD2JSI1_HETSC